MLLRKRGADIGRLTTRHRRKRQRQNVAAATVEGPAEHNMSHLLYEQNHTGHRNIQNEFEDNLRSLGFYECGTSAGGTTTGDMGRAFDFSASDFATIVSTTAYVDKSLMIKDVYYASPRIMITAPPRFGKSTNLDMVKRFFEIEVDARGNPKPERTTNNYRLFNCYNLEICKEVGFFNENFGKYPVVHIDFKPLGRVDDSAKIFDALKIITENSFNEHSYVLKSYKAYDVFRGITGFNRNHFTRYVCGEITEYVDDEKELANSFKHLSTILNTIFGKTVFVLIDSYDAFLDSPLYKNHTHRENVESFVVSSIVGLLNNVNCVHRVLITGVIPMMAEELLSSKNNIEVYQFLDIHPFTKYYGLTFAEVDTVVNNVIQCNEERGKVKNTINDYYSAYKSRNRGIRVYNIWSVLQYVCRRTVQSYWCEPRYINKFRKCFENRLIRQKLQKLLFDNELELDTSQPMRMIDILTVNNIMGGDRRYKSKEIELCFVVLYHFGYLSVIRELSKEVVCVKIPSEEIKYELAKAVLDENRSMELYSSSYLNDISSVLDAIQPDATELHQNVETLLKNMKIDRWMIPEYLEFLYVNLVTSAKYSRVIGRTLGPNGFRAILLKNEHKVAICVTWNDTEAAERAHKKVTNDGGGEHIFDGFNDVRGKVIIAIDSWLGVTIAYSFYFKTGDNLQEVRTLNKSIW